MDSVEMVILNAVMKHNKIFCFLLGMGLQNQETTEILQIAVFTAYVQKLHTMMYEIVQKSFPTHYHIKFDQFLRCRIVD